MTFRAVYHEHRFIPNIKVIYHDINKKYVGEFWFRKNRWYPNQCYKCPPRCICFNHFIIERFGQKQLICYCYLPAINKYMLNEKEQQDYCNNVADLAWQELEEFNDAFGKQYNMFGGMD